VAQSVSTIMRPFSPIATAAAVANAATSSFHDARENRTSLGASLLVGAVDGAGAAANRISGAATAAGIVNSVAHIVDPHNSTGLPEVAARLAAGTPREVLRAVNPIIQIGDSMTRYDRAAGQQVVDRQLNGQYGEFARTSALIGAALSGERGRSEIIERASDGQLGALGRLATGLVDRLAPPAGQTFQRSAVTDRPAERTREQPHHRAPQEHNDAPRGEPARVSMYTDPDTGERFHIISNNEAKLVERDEPGEQGGPTWTIEKDPETGEITHIREDGESMTVIQDKDVEQLDESGSWITESDTVTGQEWDVHEQDGEMTFVPHEPGIFQPQPPDERAPSESTAASSRPVTEREQGIVRPASSDGERTHRTEYSPAADGQRSWPGDRPPGDNPASDPVSGSRSTEPRTLPGDRPPGSDLSTASHGGQLRPEARSDGRDERTHSDTGRTRLDDRQQGAQSARSDGGERQQRQERDVGSRSQDTRGSTSEETQRRAAEERQRETERQRQQQSEQQRVGGRNQ